LHYDRDAFQAYIFGSIPGAIQGANHATKRVPMIYCLTDGKRFLLNKNNLLFLLDKHLDLREQYLAEEDQESEAAFKKYIAEINKRYE
jgi:hypothetical protein